MEKEEIYFLRKIGFPIKDEKEIVTTDRIDRFPNITNYIEEMGKISGEDMSKYKNIIKNTVYVSCMLYYTIFAYKKKLISEEIYTNTLKKATNLLSKVKSDLIIGMTLLYEGPHYLHPEILPVYEKAGHTKTVKLYIELFGQDILYEEKQRNFTPYNSKEKEVYMGLYNIFIQDDFSDVDWNV